MVLRTASAATQAGNASSRFTTGVGWPPSLPQYLSSPGSIANLGGPSGLLETGAYPVRTDVLATDLISAEDQNSSPENRAVRYAESRTDTLRGVLNELIQIANLIAYYFVDRDGVESASGMRQNLDMNFKKIVNVAQGLAASDVVTVEQVTEVSNQISELAQVVANDLVKRDGSQTMLGSVNLAGNRVTNAGLYTESYSAVPNNSLLIQDQTNTRLAQGFSQDIQSKNTLQNPPTSSLSLGGNAIVNARPATGTTNVVPQSHWGVTLQDLNREIDIVQNKKTIYTGTIIPFAGMSGLVPTGWLVCDGTFVLRVLYPDLFDALAYWFTKVTGSYNPTHFKLPDLRGRSLAGSAQQGSGSPALPQNTFSEQASDLASAFGLELVQLLNNTLPAHAHSFQDYSHVDHNTGSSVLGMQLDFSHNNAHWKIEERTLDNMNLSLKTSYPSPFGFNPAANDVVGPHQNCQPSAAVTWIIKT